MSETTIDDHLFGFPRIDLLSSSLSHPFERSTFPRTAIRQRVSIPASRAPVRVKSPIVVCAIRVLVDHVSKLNISLTCEPLLS